MTGPVALDQGNTQRLNCRWQLRKNWTDVLFALRPILDNPGAFASKVDALKSSAEAKRLLPEIKRENIRSLSRLSPRFIAGKTFVVRVDYNDVHQPYDDDIRLRASLKTLKHILDNRGKVVVLTYRGRPQVFEQAMTTDSLVEAIQSVLPNINVHKIEGEPHAEGIVSVVPSSAVELVVALATEGTIVLLDNLRFDQAEASPFWDQRHPFCLFLSMLGDVYVLDGYPISHHDNASVTELLLYLPSVAGFWLEDEIAAHRQFHELMMKQNCDPMLAMFGGIKPDKLEHIKPLCQTLQKGDTVFIGGILAYHARTVAFFQDDLPAAGIRVVFQDQQDDGRFDISDAILKQIIALMDGQKIVFWNGAFGQIELPQYQTSYAVVRELYRRLLAPLCSIERLFFSGRETAPMVKASLGLTEETRHFTPGLYISTGGGTSLHDLGQGVDNLGYRSLWGMPETIMLLD
ncbi:hypothetical protein COT42_01500 [Candidatus Saganbacteria bacterium CG08_land_8_20_14_0_20_45_16]|uniref:Phosphoglycerate kinase n=1 Tax=Candidatus Saganbacteria bacterium CG08_land_8_20_14_0_20_45_16 TaxID=2014293 RepID=A0A2H0Y3E0_UNCSA|nr:MAG: hypothetical protein COT42_01500 [Candidatus Saganbacteria bacterium CG08_land_8_20_14_0_20_45_16]